MGSKQGSLAWENLKYDLHPWLKEAIKSLHFPTMTPVQASTIPLLSGNKDVVVEAVTGLGKTLAFALPVLQKVSQRLYVGDNGESPEPIKKGHFLGLILVPTRELASQIQSVFDSLLEFLPHDLARIKTQLLVGSLLSVREDLDVFLGERNHILIATPGRMMDFLGSQYVKTSSCEIAILDEADKLLDASFSSTVVTILKRMPKQRRTGLFSATISAAGDTIFKTGMNNPVKICVKPKEGSSGKSAPTSLTISYMAIESRTKLVSLVKILEDYRYKKCIVYLPTCMGVKHFYAALSKVMDTNSIKLFSLHGQLATKARLKTLGAFTQTDSLLYKGVLLTTDVAARGIDIPDVDLVVQMDPPMDPDVFLHRCGRTGRANKVGQAIVMLNRDTQEEEYVTFMKVKGAEMKEMAPPIVGEDDLLTLEDQIRKYMLADRSRHELAVKAYVGFIRYYSKHLASSIFRLQTLDYLGIARMYGLLRLPKMPETRYILTDEMPEDGWLGPVIDMDAYKYADSQKEAVRAQNVEDDKAKRIESAKRRKELRIQNGSWLSKAETKENKQERREKLKRKREAIEAQILKEDSDDEQEQDDWKDIVRKNKKSKNLSEMQGSFDDL